jgi:CBS domain-containing protein
MSESMGDLAPYGSGADATLIPYKTAREVLASKPPAVYAVAPGDSVLSALRVMADKNIGLVVVLEGTRMVGVLSERDYARKVALLGRSSKDTLVRDIMTTAVVHVAPTQTVAECMGLMDEKRFRHLPVVEGSQVLGVLSIRDLQKEVIHHHARLISMLEIERTGLLNQSGSY